MDKFKLGDLVLVKDDGYEGCHLAVYLGKCWDHRTVYLNWLDGKRTFEKVFISDFGKRFKRVKVLSSSDTESLDECVMSSNLKQEDVEVYGLSVVVKDTRLFLKEKK